MDVDLNPQKAIIPAINDQVSGKLITQTAGINPRFVNNVTLDHTFTAHEEYRYLQLNPATSDQILFKFVLPHFTHVRDITIVLPVIIGVKAASSTTTPVTDPNTIMGSAALAANHCNLAPAGLLQIFGEELSITIGGVDIFSDFSRTQQGIAMTAKSLKGDYDMYEVHNLVGPSKYFYGSFSRGYNPIYDPFRNPTKWHTEFNLFKILGESGLCHLSSAANATERAGHLFELLTVPLALLHPLFQQDIHLPPGVEISISFYPASTKNSWAVDETPAQQRAKADYRWTTFGHKAIPGTVGDAGQWFPFKQTWANVKTNSYVISLIPTHQALAVHSFHKKCMPNIAAALQEARILNAFVYNYTERYRKVGCKFINSSTREYRFILTPNQTIPQIIHIAWVNPLPYVVQDTSNALVFDGSNATTKWAYVNTLDDPNGDTTHYFAGTPLMWTPRSITISRGGYNEIYIMPRKYDNTSWYGQLSVPTPTNAYDEAAFTSRGYHANGVQTATQHPTVEFFQRYKNYEQQKQSLNGRPDLDYRNELEIPLDWQTTYQSKGDYISLKINPCPVDIGIYNNDSNTYVVQIAIEMNTEDPYLKLAGFVENFTECQIISDIPAQFSVTFDGTVERYVYPKLLQSNTSKTAGNVAQAIQNAASG
jgi:hypothetical protein